MDNVPSWLKSRKLRTAIAALATILLTAWVNGEQVDPNTIIQAVAGIAMALMGSIAYEDGKRAEAQAKAAQGEE